MKLIYKHIVSNTHEKVLLSLAVISFCLFGVANLRPEVWDILENTKLEELLTSDGFASFVAGISGSLVAAYIFHFISVLLPQSKDSFIAREELARAYEFTRDNLCFHHLTFEQSQRFAGKNGQKYNEKALELAKESINAPQVFLENSVKKTKLSPEQIEVHRQLVERYDYIVSLAHSRKAQFEKLEPFYKYYDADTVLNVQAFIGSLSFPKHVSRDTLQAKHVTLINCQRGLLRTMKEYQNKKTIQTI